jgi:Arc/MetJ-type ribon-helix-helix transcriptional regulator
MAGENDETTPEDPLEAAEQESNVDPDEFDAMFDTLTDAEEGKSVEPTPEASDPAPGEGDKTTGGDTPSGEKGEADTAELEKALTALRRDKVPKATLEGMDDAAILEWGSQRASEQAKVDQAYADLAKSKETVEGDPGASTEPDSAGDIPADEGGPSEDTLGALQTIVDSFGGDKEAGDAIAAYHTAAVRDAVAPLQAENDSLKAGVGQLTEAVKTLMFDGAANDSEFRERYPELRKADIRGKVAEKTDALIKTGEYDSMAEAVGDAARLILGDGITPKVRAERARVEKMKSNGPPADSQIHDSANPSQSEREMDYLDARFAGETDSAARSKLGI